MEIQDFVNRTEIPKHFTAEFHDWLIFDSPQADTHLKVHGILKYLGAWDDYVQRMWEQMVISRTDNGNIGA